ncbi:MAG: hypothetical protein ACOCQQ_02805 [Candidatus Nanoarchaeia archaeon]
MKITNDFEPYGKRPYCLLNDKGFYFEEYTKDIPNVLKYPTYTYILEHLQEIVHGDKIVYVHEAQKKEIALLRSYLPVFTIKTQMNRIIPLFIADCCEYDEKEVLRLAQSYKNRYVWLSVFAFGRLHKKYDLNPSLLFTTRPVEFMWCAYNLDDLTQPKEKNYLSTTEYFNPFIFLELITADLLGEETRESKALEKFLQLQDREEFSAKELGMPKELVEELFKEGELYKDAKGNLVRIQ